MNRSSVDNLALLISEIEKQFYKKKSVAVVFLDIKGTYDNVDPESLIKDLIDLKLSSNLLVFIYNLISVRQIQFIVSTARIILVASLSPAR